MKSYRKKVRISTLQIRQQLCSKQQRKRQQQLTFNRGLSYALL